MLPPVPAHPLLSASQPFSIGEARAWGLDEAELRRLLRRGDLRTVCRSVYVGAHVEDSVTVRARAHARVLPATSAVSHESAAALWGVDVADTRFPAPDLTVTVLPSARAPRWPRVRVVQGPLAADAVCTRHGVRSTSDVRTAADLMRERPLVEAVVALDGMAARRPALLLELPALLTGFAGRRGIVVARQALPHAEPLTESPMETRLRMVLVLAGLTRPVAQHEVSARGHFVARLDLAYPELRLGLEYDGRAAHPAGFARDRERANALEEAGWVILRFAAEDVLQHPERTVALVRRLLGAQEARRAAGWPGSAPRHVAS